VVEQFVVIVQAKRNIRVAQVDTQQHSSPPYLDKGRKTHDEGR
jgi:hypothetical protein